MTPRDKNETGYITGNLIRAMFMNVTLWIPARVDLTWCVMAIIWGK